MICPICNGEMKKMSADTSYDLRTPGKEYDRTVYHCETDGTWGNIEIPKNIK